MQYKCCHNLQKVILKKKNLIKNVRMIYYATKEVGKMEKDMEKEN